MMMNNNFKSFKFNQDNSSFIFINNTGFSIHKTNDFFSKKSKKLPYKISCIEMLYSSNIFAFSLEKHFIYKNIEYNLNKLILWDEITEKKIDFIKFKDKIIDIILTKKYIFISTYKTIYIYNLNNFELIERYETDIKNINFTMKVSLNNDILVFPGFNNSFINIIFLLTKKHLIIKAHQSNISNVCLTYNGKYLATCSETSTLIRIWDTYNGKKIYEFRRGAKKSQIYSLTFSFDIKFLACISNTGTIHIFYLNIDTDKSNSFFINILPSLISSNYLNYLNSQYSIIKYKIPNNYSILRFNKNNSNILYVLSENSMFYTLNINLSDCICELINNYKIL